MSDTTASSPRYIVDDAGNRIAVVRDAVVHSGFVRRVTIVWNPGKSGTPGMDSGIRSDQ